MKHIAPQNTLALVGYGITEQQTAWVGTTDAVQTFLASTAAEVKAMPLDRLNPDDPAALAWFTELPEDNKRACQGLFLLGKRVQVAGEAFAGVYRQMIAWIQASQIPPQDLRRTLLAAGYHKTRVSEFETIAFKSRGLVNDFLTGRSGYKATLAKVRASRPAPAKPRKPKHPTPAVDTSTEPALPGMSPVDLHLLPVEKKGAATWSHDGLVPGTGGCLLKLAAQLYRKEFTLSIAMEKPTPVSVHLLGLGLALTVGQ